MAFFMTPVITLSIELSVVISFPVGEAIASGLLTIGGLLGMAVLSMVGAPFLDGSKSGVLYFHSALGGLVLITFIMNLFLKEKTLTRDYMETVLQTERKIQRSTIKAFQNLPPKKINSEIVK